MNGQTGIIFRIKKYALHDGPGIRTTVFLKGCPMSCWWCHNPEGRGYKPESMAGPEHAMAQTRVIGKNVHSEELIREIEKDTIFYDESSGGVTFSGGEPLSQLEFLTRMMAECKQRELHVAVDTSGFAPEPAMRTVARMADLILFDLKLMDEADHIRYTGVSNHPVLNNLRLLTRTQARLRIRFPLIPGITDGHDNISKMASFLNNTGCLNPLDVLPYHHTASDKYRRLGLKNMMGHVRPPGKKDVQRVVGIFKKNGLKAVAGG